MLILFKRLYLLRETLKALLYALRRYPSLLLAGLPGLVLLVAAVRCNETFMTSLGSKADEISSVSLLGLVFLNLVEILAISQQFIAWSRIADERFDQFPLGAIVSGSFKRFWEMALPLLPVWIILPYLLHFVGTLYFSLFRLFSLSGPRDAVCCLALMTFLLWPFMVVVSAKLIFLPTISLELPRKTFFSGIVSSWNYVTVKILKYHWSAFAILTLPFILGLLLPFGLLQDNLLLFVGKSELLRIQTGAVLLFWLLGPLALAGAQRLNMVLVREFEKEVRRLAEKQNA